MNYTGQEGACADHFEKQKYLIVHNNDPAVSGSIETRKRACRWRTKSKSSRQKSAKTPNKIEPKRRTESSQIAEHNRAKVPKCIANALMMRYHRGCEVMM